MSKKVLLVVPPALPYSELFSKGDASHYEHYIPTSIPLGVLSLASHVKSRAFNTEVRVLDFNIVLVKMEGPLKDFETLSANVIKSITEDFKPDIIGISAIFNSTFSYLPILTSLFKKEFRRAAIVAGGGLPTNLYSRVLESSPDLDAVCYGEGEIPLLELVEAEDQQRALENGQTWITRTKLLDNSFTPGLNLVIDLDEIPAIPYELISFEDYQINSRFHGDKEARAVSLMTTRGCPFRCCFCASHTVHGKKIRVMSAERVLQDIKQLVKEYKIDTILFEDDHFLFDKKRALTVLRGLVGLDLNLEFPNGLAVYSIDEEVAEALSLAGATSATLAIESGSENVLRNIIHKPLKLSMVSRAITALRANNIYVRAFFIIGFPGESKEDRERTVTFIKNAGLNWAAIMIASPIAGSELYKQCVEKGYLVTDNIEDFHYGQGNIKTEDFAPADIETERYLINLDVNFVNNSDMKLGKNDIALIGFNDVLKRVPTHAFAHYYAAQCYYAVGDTEKADFHSASYETIVASDHQWAEYANYFHLASATNTD